MRRWRVQRRGSRLHQRGVGARARGGRGGPCKWRSARRRAARHPPRSPAASAGATRRATPARTRNAAGSPSISTHLHTQTNLVEVLANCGLTIQARLEKFRVAY